MSFAKSLLYRWRWAILHSDLASTARLILLTLSMHMKSDGSSCFVGLRTLAREAHLHRSTIIRQLRELDGEWIRVVRRKSESGDAAPNTYLPLIPEGVGAEGDQVGARGDHVGGLRDQGGRTMRPKVGAEGDPNPTGNTRTNSVDARDDYPSLQDLRRNGRGREYPAAFEGAFRALPLRDRPHPKAAAYKAWRARVAEGIEPFQLEAAALAYAEDAMTQERTKTRYVMQAPTFFGPGERWKPYSGIDPIATPAAETTSDSIYQRLR